MRVSKGIAAALATSIAITPATSVMAQTVPYNHVQSHDTGSSSDDGHATNLNVSGAFSDNSLSKGTVQDRSDIDQASQSGNGWLRSNMVDNPDLESDFVLSKATVHVRAGEVRKLEFSGSVDKKNISWSSSRSSVVQVDANGYVYGVRSGVARITAWCDGKKQSVRVRVDRNPMMGENTTTEVYVRKGYHRTAPRLKGVSLKSTSYNSAGNILVKNGHRTFRGIKQGHETVTMTSPVSTSTVEYFVEDPSADIRDITISEGESRTLVLNGVYRNVKWSSSDRKTAVVDSNGVVVGLKPGKVRITATIGGRHVKYYVTVAPGTREYKTDEHKNVVEVIRQSKYVELHMYSDGRYDIVQKRDYAGTHDLKHLSSEGHFLAMYSQTDSESYDVRLVGLTEDGKAADSITIPLKLGDAHVCAIDDSVLNAKDVVFEDGYKGMTDIIPDSIRDHIYENGNFRYRYVKEGDHLTAEITGISDAGRNKDVLNSIPSYINGVKVHVMSFENVTSDGCFVAQYSRNVSGNFTARLTDITQDGKQSGMITVPLTVDGADVTSVSDSAINASDVVFVNSYKGRVDRLPDTLSDHVYENGDFRYRYVKDGDHLVVELVGLSDAGMKNGKCIIPVSIHGIKVSGYKFTNGNMIENITSDELFVAQYSRDTSGNYTVRLTDLTEKGLESEQIVIPLSEDGAEVSGVDDSALNAKDIVFENGYEGMADRLPDSISDHIYENGSFRYRYVKEGDHLVAEITGLSESGKQNNVLSSIPDSINGVKVTSMSIENTTLDGCFIGQYDWNASGEYSIGLTGLTDKGMDESSLTIPLVMDGADVTSVSDSALKAKDIAFEDGYNGRTDMLPDSLSEHIYESGDFLYHYVKEGDHLVAEITGLSESGMKKGKCRIPVRIHDINIIGIKSDLSGGNSLVSIGGFIYVAKTV